MKADVVVALHKGPLDLHSSVCPLI